MPDFHHGRLIVYRRAIEFVAVAAEIIPTIEPTYRFLRDQLGRAATSIALNVAEGSGEFSKPEKARFYRMARRSAAECAAILEALEVVKCPDAGRISLGKEQLNEIMAMLTVMARVGSGEGRARR